MENSNSLGGARIALLIDFDNVILGIDDPGFDVELVVNALRERGTIVVSRVYGDWYRHSRHRRHLMEHGLELVEAPAFGPVIKNSADIKIALDGYEIGMTMPHINTFCLVSGDSDFLPLVKKLQGLGKNVLIICGNRFTSDMLRRNCNEFISYENLLAASYGADEDATTIEGAFALLHRAMAALRERGSEIRTSTLKQMMIQLNPVFSEKTFGYNQFRGFLDKAGRENLIKLGPRDRVSGEFYVLLPDEDEAEVIEQIERAEPAAVVEEIVESRRGGRNRRGSDNAERNGAERNGAERNGAERNGAERNGAERNGSAREKRREGAPAATETPTESPRVSRREARLMALREQQELEQQAPTDDAPTNDAPNVAAPLASPLTPATDFSPADETESREKSIARTELLARGLRVGRVRFSGKTGRAEAVAPTRAAEAPLVDDDIALTIEDAKSEDAPVEATTAEATTAEATTAEATTVEATTIEAASAEMVAAETEAPATVAEETPAETASEKPKRSRSRRRKKTSETPAGAPGADAPTADAPGADAPTAAETPDETPVAEVATPAESSSESAPETVAVADESANFEARESAPTSEAAEAESAPEAEATAEKKPRRRRTSRKKTDETPAATDADAQTAQQQDAQTGAEADEAQTVAKEKPRRTRRSKKTEETSDEMEKAIQPDGTEQTVSQEALIEASADTPAAKKSTPRSRKTARKKAEAAAEAKASVDENIVTTDETTGEVSQKELAQIPVPVSEDEV